MCKLATYILKRLDKLERRFTKLEKKQMADEVAREELRARVAGLEQNQADTLAAVTTVTEILSGVRTELAAVQVLLAEAEANSEVITEVNGRLAALEVATQGVEDQLVALVPAPPVE